MNKAKSKNLRQRKPESEDINGTVNKESEKEQREMERQIREKIVLWRSPVTTLRYFILEASTLFTLLCARYVTFYFITCIVSPHVSAVPLIPQYLI